MALKQQNKQFKGLTILAAYIRIDRVFGGKHEGWNAVVGVYASQEAAVAEPPLEQFNVSAQYSIVEANPYALLYSAIKDTPGLESCVDI